MLEHIKVMAQKKELRYSVFELGKPNYYYLPVTIFLIAISLTLFK